MSLNRLSFLIFFIPIVIGMSTTVSKVLSAANSSVNVHNASLKVVNNSATNLSIITEGGFVGAQGSITTASKENITTLLIKTQSDPVVDSSAKNKGKSVVGRKGVDFNLLDDSAEVHKPEKASEVKDTSTKAPNVKSQTILANKVTNSNVQTEKTKSTTPVPHKPFVLSSAALERLGADKTLSLVEEGMKQKQAVNPGSHPGMIMPVVITILVVPMFAVLGYMALKRGQEAWKNRHYKRMDFLLDGMYND